MFGRALALLGDVDGDLCEDVLIGIPLSRQAPEAMAAVELWSGRTGQALWRIEDAVPSFGATVAALGDLDGDGVRDFVVGRSPMRLDDDAPGSAFLGSGRTGRTLREFVAERDGVWFGGAVANARDVSGDGLDDVLVGGNFGGAPGLVSVFDGRTGALLSSYADDDPDAGFGNSVLGVGDLDGDGKGEIVVTAPGPGRGNDGGRVLVLSSRTGKSLYELRGERSREGFGSHLLWLPDWRHDGTPALAVGTRSGGPVGNGYLRIFDLRSGAPLQTFAGNVKQNRFAYSLVDLGDRDLDGLRDLGVLSWQHDNRVDLFALTFADAFPPGSDGKR